MSWSRLPHGAETLGHSMCIDSKIVRVKTRDRSRASLAKLSNFEGAPQLSKVHPLKFGRKAPSRGFPRSSGRSTLVTWEIR